MYILKYNYVIRFLFLLLLIIQTSCGNDFIFDQTGSGLDSNKQSITSLIASDGEFMDRIFVQWNKITNAESYNLYRSELLNGAYNLIASNIKSENYEDYNIEEYVKYYYKVAYVDIKTNLSSLSIVYDDGYATEFKWPALQNITVTQGQFSEKVVISWDSTTNASFYNIYRADSLDGPYTILTNNLIINTFEDTNISQNSHYFYIVVYFDSKNRISLFPQPAEGWCGVSQSLVPDNLNVSDGTYSDKILTSWNTVVGAVDYQVYRSDSSDGGYIRIGTNIANTQYEDSSVEFNRSYYYRISAVFTDGSESDACNPEKGYKSSFWNTKPFLSVSEGHFIDYIYLRWDAVPDSSHYAVYRSETLTGEYLLINGNIDTTNYSDNTINNKHYYKISAFNSNNTEGLKSEPAEGYSRNTNAPAKPDNVVGYNGGVLQIKVTWDAVDNASYYRVYSSETINGIYTIASASQQSLEYKKNMTLDRKFFKISAFNSNDQEGPLSEPVESCSQTLVSTPYNLSATDGVYNDRIVLNWNSSYGVTKYFVYRAESRSGPYQDISGDLGTDTTYTDYNVKPGIYYYKVLAKNLLYTSAYSLSDSGYIMPYPIPSVPGNFKATDGEYSDKIILSWDTADNTEYYQIYRAVNENGLYTNISGLFSNNSNSFVDSSVLDNKKYYYRISSFNANGYPSSSSITESGFASNSSFYNKPEVVLATDGTEENKVTILWTAVQGASYYRIYRADKSDGIYISISDKIMFGETSYNDLNIKSSKYYYKVGAFKADNKMLCISGYDEGFAKQVAVPEMVTGLIASDGEYTNKIVLEWNTVDNAEYYKIAIANKENGSYVFINDKISNISFEYFNKSAGPIYFKVSAFNSDDRYGMLSASDLGYIKLNAKDMFIEYDRTILRSHEKLTLIHNSGINALGKEYKNGDISGQVYYDAHTKGVGGEVFINYYSYCDFYMVLEGKQTTLASMSGDGKMTGKVYFTSDVYNGYVRYDINVEDEDPVSGYYYVSQNGGPEEAVEFFPH